MRQQCLVLGLVLLVLVGCAAPAPRPEATVVEALSVLEVGDAARLAELYDPEAGSLRGSFARVATGDWAAVQKPPPPGQDLGYLLGPIQEQRVQPAELSGQTAVVPVRVRYKLGERLWTFKLRLTDQGWRLTNIGDGPVRREPSSMWQRLPTG
ncbi:MAG TPA: hypothetical protein VFS21_37585 [Roseiflexaceae bacterium]|nr:hypothetical protein [Roseiflexaceae bacterium]